ncbi:potassium-transporting ATPase subunit KdpA [Gordonia jinhuaensis]|uniref:Potassium-transporting ATPase potassium-binding subunit n=1 Tax=Gordonia jinhuaensis TaxID=1517702 RepID=A0A916SYL3_9ACTN|nr:potassium-transporting ATPase subunit KdpA [Gordonia jinhuaensis]GGB20352.1 potassium-transporting ATPase potassium-binding subunit [Gordonia jinhuaensis]
MSAGLAAALQVGAVLLILALAYRPLGDYMARVFTSEKDLRVERGLYRIARIDARHGQTWGSYAVSALSFSLVGVLALYLIQRLQGVVPANGGHSSVTPYVALNTAVSFVTNTNWQSYSPELTMGNLTQAAGLAVQNFVSAAVGLAIAIALIRGIAAARGRDDLGNFWVDITRAALRILLPLAFLVALILLTQGVVQSWHAGFDFVGIDGARQHAVLAPAASQEAIKEVGTNGGGIFNANSAHPFENPTPLSNIVEIIAMLVIPVALVRTYGTMVKDQRQGYTILSVMAVIWGAMLTVIWVLESRTHGVAADAAGSMMEGKEQRFGIPGSVLFATSTTGTSTGAVNSAHDSYSAGGGGALLWNMLLGEVAPGGVGAGMYSILVFAIIAVFVGGLLVGRTPHLLGKKIGQQEITMAALSILVMPILVLTGAAISYAIPSAVSAMGNSGDHGSASSMHGFTEVLYAFASAANNNGSAFGGITVTSPWYQIALSVAMWLGRFLPIVFILALAGLLAAQRSRPATTATLPTHGALFSSLLGGTIVLVAGLTFFPAIALGPIAEALS